MTTPDKVDPTPLVQELQELLTRDEGARKVVANCVRHALESPSGGVGNISVSELLPGAERKAALEIHEFVEDRLNREFIARPNEMSRSGTAWAEYMISTSMSRFDFGRVARRMVAESIARAFSFRLDQGEA